jgi:DNA repair exonuclease SbcCD ATPase subunit
VSVAALGVGLLLVARRLQLRYEQQRTGHELREIDIDRRLRGRSQLQQELVDRELEAAGLLKSLDLADLVAAEALLEREQEHISLIGQLDAQLQGLAGSIPPEAVVPERNAAALEIERKTHALEELGPIAREPRARERLEAEAREAEAHLERERDAEARARASVESNRVDAEEVAASVERLALAEEQLTGLQRRHRVYTTTLAAIEEAERSTMRTATRYLERSMVADIERITRGRYRRVRVDDTSLGIEVFAPERGDWVDVSVLSQGTLDLIYLAARLGLVRLVTGDRRPPLVFDDPFVTLDDDRAKRAMEMLREIARDFQIIYLTTSDRYDSSADAVRVLPAPAERDELPDGDGTGPAVAG